MLVAFLLLRRAAFLLIATWAFLGRATFLLAGLTTLLSRAAFLVAPLFGGTALLLGAGLAAFVSSLALVLLAGGASFFPACWG
jgi:hypothetical protein